ncbi:MAG: type I restriction endonuclease subunit R, partial [Betaproteobacteria bacterium]|nr:type I restriction endonuclease subunit R [Betaproteobacteria bacterium]
MSDLHQEHHFEATICQHLAANGWRYAEGDAANYDRHNALYLPDLLAWLEATQPDSWQRLNKTHGADLPKRLAERLRKSMNERGTLDVLRRGVDMLGLSKSLSLVQFKPALGINPTIQQHYAANRLRVIRQVHHSLNNQKESIDLVLFVNGIPVATVELKSDFTQSVGDAVDQYRFDRNPSPKGGLTEPLLSFPGGALVHFAVSQREVMMTTRLAGTATRFLPFNKGDNGAAGNPVNSFGFATHYLWEEVWQRDSWLEILGRYLIGQRDDKKQLTGVIFPRYHQLDATRKLLADVLESGAKAGSGQRYLIQHSAGSGKTNSIAWTAHFLADLHDANHQKMFDSVLVVSDRTVLDDQLQEAIFDFQRTTGVVEKISNDSGSKSAQLSRALKAGKKIIVCTIQTFPFALKAVQELAATEGKRFAVIADEAHSSQTGEAAAKLKQLLSAEELAELQDGGEISTEDLLAVQMAGRVGCDDLTYIAFTATPKQKTLELFGRQDESGLPKAFHVYSMRQAIEEGFILDVLKNYTPYKLAFKLANNGEEYDEKQVERSTA